MLLDKQIEESCQKIEKAIRDYPARLLRKNQEQAKRIKELEGAIYKVIKEYEKTEVGVTTGAYRILKQAIREAKGGK